MERNALLRLLKRVRKELHYGANGQLLSKRKGEGFDFAELIPYMEGMDARKIFWKSLARGETLQFKTFFEERQISVATALLLNGSLMAGEGSTKFEKALEAAAFWGYTTLLSGNLFQGLALHQEGVVATPPSKSHAAVDRFILDAGAVDLLYTHLSCEDSVETLNRYIAKKSLLILIGDFLDLCDLRRLAARHAIFAVIVRDRFEADPKPLGDVAVEDPETGEEIELFFDRKLADAYAKAFHKHDRKLLAHFRKLGIAYTYLYTDEKAGGKFSAKSTFT
jgi:uncharacterized protein (DUF58 family)